MWIWWRGNRGIQPHIDQGHLYHVPGIQFNREEMVDNRKSSLRVVTAGSHLIRFTYTPGEQCLPELGFMPEILT